MHEMDIISIKIAKKTIKLTITFRYNLTSFRFKQTINFIQSFELKLLLNPKFL